jgi:hypothetical protein
VPGGTPPTASVSVSFATLAAPSAKSAALPPVEFAQPPFHAPALPHGHAVALPSPAQNTVAALHVRTNTSARSFWSEGTSPTALLANASRSPAADSASE